MVIGALLVATVATFFGWRLGSSRRPSAPLAKITRFTAPVVGGHEMLYGENLSLAISPDGRTLAYVADEMLRVRQFGNFEDLVLAGC